MEEKGLIMKTKVIIGAAVLALGCCAYVHRRVIKAVLTGGEMPKAPNWHVWVAPENRRGE